VKIGFSLLFPPESVRFEPGSNKIRIEITGGPLLDQPRQGREGQGLAQIASHVVPKMSFDWSRMLTANQPGGSLGSATVPPGMLPPRFTTSKPKPYLNLVQTGFVKLYHDVSLGLGDDLATRTLLIGLMLLVALAMMILGPHFGQWLANRMHLSSVWLWACYFSCSRLANASCKSRWIMFTRVLSYCPASVSKRLTSFSGSLRLNTMLRSCCFMSMKVLRWQLRWPNPSQI
jgi:hypothetical protein